MQQAMVGLKEYIAGNGFVLFYLLAMLVCLFRLRELWQSRARKLVWYALAAGIAVLCPITAKILMIYQTAFYPYQWIWSFVPLTAVSAWFLCEFIFSGKRKQVVLWMILVAVLFVYGNQGMITKGTSAAEFSEEEVRELLQEVGLENFEKGLMWAPKEIMEYSRKASGEIKVLYGRSMWEAEAAAYDYEIYLNDLVDLYEWMEGLKKGQVDLEESKEMLQNGLMYPLSVVVFPAKTMMELEEVWMEALEWSNLSMKEEFVSGQYYVAVIAR